MKKLLLVNDICCFGNVALSISQPIAKTLHCDVDVLPTVLLSSHTAYQNVFKHPLTNEMQQILQNFQKNNIQHDLILTGYFYDANQIETFIQYLSNHKLLIVDPIMGDLGKLYTGIKAPYIHQMQQLIKKADYILPNLTEACFLTNTPYPKQFSEKFVEDIVQKLHEMHVKHVMITGIQDEDKIHVVYSHQGQITWFTKPQITGNFYGTGDLFSAIIACFIINAISIEIAIPYAMDFVIACIQDTKASEDIQKGIIIQKQLKHLSIGAYNE